MRFERSKNTNGCSLYACDNNRALLGETGLQVQATAEGFVGNITWSIESFSGDIENVSIDQNGLITYDGVSTLSNQGLGEIVYKAKGPKGECTEVLCVVLKDPVDVCPLACNDDLVVSNPDLAAKFTLFARVDENSVFQDVAKTTPSTDGTDAAAVEDANGNGDLTVRSGNTAPQYNQGVGPNGNDCLQFDGAGESLQYDVAGAPAPGSPFSFFSLFSIDPAANDSNATLIASTTQANNNTTGSPSWQIARHTSTNDFGFRLNTGSWTNINVGTLSASPTDITAVPWTTIKDGQPHLLFVDYDGTTLRMYIDGTLRIEADPDTAILGGEHFKFFENRAGSNFLAGNLYEALFGDASLTQEEKDQTQAYLLCKFGLDLSQLTATGPFSLEKGYYSQLSQFELHIFSDNTQQVFDTLNNTYYETDDVPLPGLGFFLDCKVESIQQLIARDGGATSEVTPVVTGNTIATHDDGAGTTVDIQETITSLSVAGNILTYRKEDGSQDTIDLSVYIDDTNLAMIVSGMVNAAGIATFTRDDGSSFTIDFSQFFDDTNSTVTNTQAGNTIATHDDGNGNTTDINETVTSISFASNTLTYDKEDGTQDSIDLSSLQSTITDTGQLGVQNHNAGSTEELHNLYSSNGELDNDRFVDLNDHILELRRESGTDDRAALTIRRTTDNSAQETGITFQNTGSGKAATIYHNLQSGNPKPQVQDDGLTIATIGNEVDVNNIGDTATFGDNGQMLFHEYGTGNFDDNNPARILGVDTDGCMVEVNPNNLGGAVSTLTDSNNGNVIATHNDGNGTTTNIEETVTGFSVAANTITYRSEDGTTDTASLNFTTQEIYEYRDIWAEEGGGMASGSAQWSFGNGDTGAIGLPIDDGWEVEAMYFQSDNNGPNDDLTVNLVDFRTPTGGAPVISTVTVTNAGSGTTNNAYIYQEYATPPAVPAGSILGFLTGTEVGAFSSARVGARLRRKVADVVVGVTLT